MGQHRQRQPRQPLVQPEQRAEPGLHGPRARGAHDRSVSRGSEIREVRRLRRLAAPPHPQRLLSAVDSTSRPALTTRARRGILGHPCEEASMPAPKLPTQADVESYFKRLNNWGRWGQDDQRGTVNLITDARRAAARALVKTGRTVSLSREIVAQPHLQFMYHVTCPSKRERADVVLDRFDLVYHGFWITHVDALCHVGWDGELYNGRSFAYSLSAAGSTWCPIDPLFDGILTRGVLLDV